MSVTLLITCNLDQILHYLSQNTTVNRNLKVIESHNTEIYLAITLSNKPFDFYCSVIKHKAPDLLFSLSSAFIAFIEFRCSFSARRPTAVWPPACMV